MRIAIKRITEWIHTTLILAMILPLLYSLVAEQPDIMGRNLYVKCLVIMLPVMATDFAIHRCKGLLSYLLICAMTVAATSALGRTVAGSLQQSALLWVYMAVLMLETLFLIVCRMANRLQKKKDEDDFDLTDPTWRPSIDSLRSPSFTVLIYFLVIYVSAINLNNPAVCNAALFSAVVYTVITILHQYISETENYLSLNKRTCNIPSKRIYGIGAGMLAIFLILFMIAILPALFTASNRHYRDLRKSAALIEFHLPEMPQQSEIQPDTQNPIEMLMGEDFEVKPPPPWLDTLLYILEVIVFIGLVAALIKVIYDTFRSFRKATDENGDIVEELEETDEGVKIKNVRVSRRKLSERERIRKEYRKFIRRYRKERPAHYESPTEIEKNAGIAEDEECKVLHKHYELARYGQET